MNHVNDLFDSERVYTVGEVATALRVSRVTLLRAIHKGRLRALRVGGQWRILGREAMRFLDEGTKQTLAERPLRAED